MASQIGADAVYGYGKYGSPDRPLSQGTFGEAHAFGQSLIPKTRGKVGAGANKGTSAVGAYQMVGSTMENYAKQAFGNDWRQVPFTFENQQKVAKLIYEDAQSGDMSKVWPTAKRGDYSNVSFEDFSREVLPRESGLSYEENLSGSGGTTTEPFMTKERLNTLIADAEKAGLTSDVAFYRSMMPSEEDIGTLQAAELPQEAQPQATEYSDAQLQTMYKNATKAKDYEFAGQVQQLMAQRSQGQQPTQEPSQAQTTEYTDAQLQTMFQNAMKAEDFQFVDQVGQLMSQRGITPNQPQVQRPDLTEAELEALPENPAEFARGQAQPDAEWIQRQYDRKATLNPYGLGAVGAGLAGAGKSTLDLVQGAGELVGIETSPQEQAMKQRIASALQTNYPIAMPVGEVAGQMAVTAPLTMATGGLGLGARMLTSGAIGAGQMGLTSLGQGDTGEQAAQEAALGGAIGAGAEAVVPPLLRGAVRVGQTIKGTAKKALFEGGAPTPALTEALESAGRNFGDLSEESVQALKDLPKGTDPAQAVRKAVPGIEGMELTTGQITQDARQLAKEAELVKSGGAAAEPLRQRLAQQGEQISDAIGNMARESGGVAARVGKSVEQSLKTQQADNELKLGLLYSQAARDAASKGGIRIRPTDTKAGIRADVMDDLKITHPAQSKALNDLLVKYGITPKPRTSNMNITPLSVANMRQFSKSLDNIAGDNPALKEAIAPIKNGLSNDVLGVTRNTNVPESIRKTLTEIGGLEHSMAISARHPFAASPDMTSRLLSDETSVHELGSLVKSFRPGTVGSKAAKADLQASSLMHILEESTASGKFSPDDFSKSLSKIGDEKLNILFGDKANNIKNMAKMGQSLKLKPGEAPSRAEKRIKDFFKNVVLNKLGTTVIGGSIGGLTGGAGGAILGGLVADVAKEAIETQFTKRSVAQALKGKPEVKKAVIELQRKYPSLFQALGLAESTQAAKDEKLTIPVRPTMESRTE